MEHRLIKDSSKAWPAWACSCGRARYDCKTRASAKESHAEHLAAIKARDVLTKAPDYLSPHCAAGNCKYCRGRREAAKRAATAAREAAAAPGMFWDSKIDRGQEQLGPSAPSSWIQSFVK